MRRRRPIQEAAREAMTRRVIDLRDSSELLPPSPYAPEPREWLPWQCEPWRSGEGLGGDRVPLAPPPTVEYCRAQYEAWHDYWASLEGGQGSRAEQAAAMDAAGYWGMCLSHRLRDRGEPA